MIVKSGRGNRIIDSQTTIKLPDPMKTIFLLGAGASTSAGLPTITELTNEFLEIPMNLDDYMDESESNRLDTIKKDVDSLAKVTENTFGKMDLELMMSLVLRLEDKNEKELFEAKYPELKNISERAILKIKSNIQSFIRRKCEDIKTIEYLWPLKGLVEKNPLDVFTLNYDGTIEIFCEKNNVMYTDGFNPDWDTESFDGEYGIRLYKLHGSLYWFRTKSNKTIKVPIKGLRVSDVKYLTDDTISEMMIYPALQKNKQLGVYSWLSQRFKDGLKNTDVCVVIGYSFRDDDIRDSIIESLSINDNLWLVILSPHASKHKMNFFSNNEEIASKIIVMNIKTEDALTERKLHSYLRVLESARRLEKEAWASQSSEAFRMDANYWHNIFHNYLTIEHLDRIKWIAERLLKEKFSRVSGNYPQTIEGVLCAKSIRYMIEYYNDKNKEKLQIWKKFFVDACTQLEYVFFQKDNVIQQQCPVKKNDVPEHLSGYNSIPENIFSELKNEAIQLKPSLDGDVLVNLDKLIQTLDTLTFREYLNPERTSYRNLTGQQILDAYKNNDLGITKWATEIANSLK